MTASYLLAVRLPCPKEVYCCGSSVVYCMVGDHRLVCGVPSRAVPLP